MALAGIQDANNAPTIDGQQYHRITVPIRRMITEEELFAAASQFGEVLALGVSGSADSSLF